MAKDSGTRKNIVLTPAALQRLEFIKKGADLSTDAEAIRETLKIFEKLMRAQLEGAQVRIEHHDDRVETLHELYEAYVAPDAIRSLDSLKQRKKDAMASLAAAS
ncbi:hypothetical protein V8J82_23220 [Gymnodinialimonas sp. 2305UL16-5]|uniref:hypothetical protein n=1 Tax=Gymnodinialimonas mytili TaxID=3126503 RepID=UPI0030A6B55E